MDSDNEKSGMISVIRLYKSDEVPDYLFEEVCQLVEKIAVAMEEPCTGHAPNIVISALNRFHAALICALVTEEGMKGAARTEAIGLYKNIEHLSGQTFTD